MPNRSSGEYEDYLQLRQCSSSKDDNGEPLQSPADSGVYIYGLIDRNGAASLNTEEGKQRKTYQQLTIYTRLIPAIRALDELKELDGTVWKVKSRSKDKWEQILDCVSYDQPA